jgi:hypothetical protein
MNSYQLFIISKMNKFKNDGKAIHRYDCKSSRFHEMESDNRMNRCRVQNSLLDLDAYYHSDRFLGIL